MRKLVLGCGYVGHRVARQWQRDGAEVHVVTRSPQRATEFSQQGLHPILADVTTPESFPDLPECETILYAIGFDRQAEKGMHAVYVEGLATVLQHIITPPRRLVYISSTGVFGESSAADVEADPPLHPDNQNTPPEPPPWTDETSPCNPTREGGIVCLAAEDLLRAHPVGHCTTILRLAGIYGPGRIPRKQQIMGGQGIAVPQSGYLNLIHVDDAVRVILAAESRAGGTEEGNLCNLYIVSDGHPVERGEYYAELARCFGAPPPKLLGVEPSLPTGGRGGGSKRLSNVKMLRELEVTLAYPTYREGLAAIVALQED